MSAKQGTVPSVAELIQEYKKAETETVPSVAEILKEYGKEEKPERTVTPVQVELPALYKPTADNSGFETSVLQGMNMDALRQAGGAIYEAKTGKSAAEVAPQKPSAAAQRIITEKENPGLQQFLQPIREYETYGKLSGEELHGRLYDTLQEIEKQQRAGADTSALEESAARMEEMLQLKLGQYSASDLIQLQGMVQSQWQSRADDNAEWKKRYENTGGTLLDDPEYDAYYKTFSYEQGKNLDLQERLKTAQQQKALEQNHGLWGSGNFADRLEDATQSGVHGAIAGATNFIGKIEDVATIGIARTIELVAKMYGKDFFIYDEMMDTADKLRKAAAAPSRDAVELQQAADKQMMEAMAGTGLIDGFIVQQMQSVGGMMADLWMGGMSGQMTGTLGTAAAPQSSTYLGMRAAGSAMIDAQKKGYGELEQILYGTTVGALEWISEKLFGGNPLYDDDKGLVSKLVETLTDNPTILRLMYSKPMGVIGEGLEEVFVEFTSPVAEYALTSKDEIDWASPKELGTVFLGGMFLGMIGTGAEMTTNIIGNAKTVRAYNRLGGLVTNLNAVQAVIDKGLQADPITDAYHNAVKLQKKVDAGKTITAKDMGKQLMANKEAINAGKLVDTEEVGDDPTVPEGKLHDPDDGFYAVAVGKKGDRNVYRLVQVHNDGSVEQLTVEGTESLFGVKIAAEIQGMKVRHIGTVQNLVQIAEAKTGETESVEETMGGEVATAPVEPYGDTEDVAAAETEDGGLQWAGNMEAERAEDVLGETAPVEDSGLQWAGTEIATAPAELRNDSAEETAAENNTETEEMTYEEQQGQSAGGDAARIGKHPGRGIADNRKQRKAGAVQRRSVESTQVRADVKALGVKPTSLTQLGLSIGSDLESNWVVPKAAWNESIQTAADFAEEYGLEFVPVVGNMFVKIDDKLLRVEAAIENGVIYVQADSMSRDVVEATLHEIFHYRISGDPQMEKRLVEYIQQNYSIEETSELFDRYMVIYREFVKGMKPDKVAEYIWQEMLADAYAELERLPNTEGPAHWSEYVRGEMEQAETKNTAEGGVRMSAYTAVRERLAKLELDKLSDRLGVQFPLSAQFTSYIRGTTETVSSPTVAANAVQRNGKSYFRAAKDEFVKNYTKGETVNMAGTGIMANLETDLVAESLSKEMKRGKEQVLLDIVPLAKDMIQGGKLLGVEKLIHTSNKKPGLFAYRVYNVFNYESTNVKTKTVTTTPYVFVATVIQQYSGNSIVHIIQGIDVAAYDRGKLGKAQESSPITGSKYTVSQLYDFVKQIPRENGGLKYTEKEAGSYLFNYTQKEDGSLYSVAGENALTADEASLQAAKDMLDMGESVESIRQKTGWYQGRDGKWRFEIDDSGMTYHRGGDAQFRKDHPEYARYRDLELAFIEGTITEEEAVELRELHETWGNEYARLSDRVDRGNATLENILDHEELYAAYPGLRGMKVVFKDLDGASGEIDHQRGTITLDKSLRDAPESTLLHEIQHAIQNAEGFAGGSSPEYWREPRMEAIKPAFQTGIKEAQEEVRRWEQRFADEWGEGSVNLMLAQRYAELSDQIDEKSLLELDNIFTLVEESGWEDMLSGYVEARAMLELKKAEALRNRYDSYTAYRNTAGEIEARDVANRRSLTAEERRRRMPDLGDEDVVFTEDRYFSMSSEDRAREHKEAQLRIIQEKSPAPNSYNTWIRSIEDVHTLDEVLEDPEWNYNEFNPDYTREMAREALRKGAIRVYSSNPIADGIFVTPSAMEAASYAGERHIYSEMVSVKDIAWIDPTQGQYAPVDQRSSRNMEEGVKSQARERDAEYTLSERFNNESTDIRFSAASSGGRTAEDKARETAERDLANGLAEIMSVPKGAVKALREGPVRKLMEEYQASGEIDQDILDEAISTAFAQGLMIDNEFYETYKHVKDYLRKTRITISEQDQADIADCVQFKKSAFGTLRIVKEGGVPVDVAYREAQEMAPGLFPESLVHPADQLIRMFDVGRSIKKTEESLEKALGDGADQYFEWAAGRMEKLIDRTLEKYAQKVTWKKPKEARKKDTKIPYVQPMGSERTPIAPYRDGAGQSYDEQDQLQWEGTKKERVAPNYDPVAPDTYDYRTQEQMEDGGQLQWEGTKKEQQPEATTAKEKALRGNMRDWIQYVLGGEMTPEEFAASMEASKSRPLEGRGKELYDRMANTARDGHLFRPDDMTDEEYAALDAQWRARQQNPDAGDGLTPLEDLIITKDKFSSTPAMEKLGIKIDGSVTRYRQTEQLRSFEKAAEQARGMLRKRVRDLNASRQELELARGLVEGWLTADALSGDNVDIDVITELADYLSAAKSFSDDMISQRKSEINSANFRIAEELFKDSEQFNPQLKRLPGLTKLIMNERTPERVVKQIFGAEVGGKIYETYFRPVWVNGAEMSRFENRMLDRVRMFEDQNGTKRKMTEPERRFAQRLMEGKVVLDSMAKLDEDVRERVEAVAQNVNNGQEFVDAVREWGLHDEYHQGIAQAYADYMDAVELSKDMDQVIMENAIAEYQKIYNEMYDAINDFLVSHGYNEIGFIKGYAPHFQKREVQQGLFSALKKLGVEKESVSSLPADIAGRTADFKPNMKWNPHAQTRTGSKTDYDIQMGFEQYLHYAAEMFYHTDDVMRVRQAVNWFRMQYSGKEIGAALEDAQADRYKTVEWKQEFLERKELVLPGSNMAPREINALYDEYVGELYERAAPEKLSKYSEFVTWLDNYANIVAGKQSLADRGLEYGGGRNALNAGSRLMRTFATSNVAGSLSSVLNQTAQLPLIQQQLGIYLERAVKDLLWGTCAKEHFAERSDFLTDKRGVDKLTVDNREKFISTLFKPAELMDRMVSTLAVRGRYLQALSEGKTAEEALREADDFGRRVMGSRMKGAKPLGFESKTFVNQMLHIFQVEASNTFDYMFLSDIPQNVQQVAKVKGKGAAARHVAAGAVGYLINAFLLNLLTGELYGGSPAPFDLIGWGLNFIAGGFGMSDDEYLKTLIDNVWERLFKYRPFETGKIDAGDGLDWAGAAGDLGYNVLNDIPYVRNIAGVMGLGDQSMPTVGINEVAGDLGDAGKTLWDQITDGEEETGLDWAGAAQRIGEDILSAASALMPGGRQIKKTYQGVKTVVQGGKHSGYGDNARMQYPVEQNVWNAIRAGLFGVSAIGENDDFYASGNSALSAGQTRKVEELEEKGIDRFTTYDLYQEFRAINAELIGAEASSAKRNSINALPLSDQQKLQMFDAFMLDRTSANYEKTLSEYQAMLDSGLSWDDVTTVHNLHAELNEDETMDATQKATELAKFIDQQGWSEEQKAALEARFRFWNMMPAAAGNYEKYEDAGVAPEAAADMAELIANLEPEQGSPSVTSNQKVLAIWNSDFSVEEKSAAVAAMFPDRRERLVEAGVSDAKAKQMTVDLAVAEAENGEEELDYMTKAAIIVEAAGNNVDAMAGLSTVLNESTYEKLEIAGGYSVTAKVWIDYREAWENTYGEDSVSQKKVQAVLDRMYIPDNAKAALWQIANKSWKPSNNPYSVGIGQDIYNRMN